MDDLDLVMAARAGDQRSLDALVARYLPLVYNIVGRALNGDPDVDDVVQETMLRAVQALGTLRDPAAFRSWLVAITVRQIRDRGRARSLGAEEIPDVADPGADFADLTILRLALSGQRRELVEASRWLDEEDRSLLSLWWLEAAGELTRAELAGALNLTPQHAAVRVQRMKGRLEAARAVVRALAGSCPELRSGWDGRPSPIWRKRLARHVRDCGACSPALDTLVAPERLLAGLALVPVPFVVTGLAALGAGAKTAGVKAGWMAMAAKPVAAVAAGTLVVAGGAAAVRADRVESPAPAAVASRVPSPSATAARPRKEVALRPKKASPRYGQTVDRIDQAPPVGQRPAALPKRPATAPITVADGSKYSEPFPGSLGGTWLMFYRDDQVILRGRGYFQVRYEIAWFNRPGLMVMPTWTGLRGKLFHVASGGFRRMDDPKVKAPDIRQTWMGEPGRGYITLPKGAQQMWQNEFFYLDGQVTLHNHERGSDYNLGVTPLTHRQVTDDLTTSPDGDPALGRVRYGLVRDTGDDAAPVPQYLTRAEGPAPQQSRVS